MAVNSIDAEEYLVNSNADIFQIHLIGDNARSILVRGAFQNIELTSEDEIINHGLIGRDRIVDVYYQALAAAKRSRDRFNNPIPGDLQIIEVK